MKGWGERQEEGFEGEEENVKNYNSVIVTITVFMGLILLFK
jgi:hypothetical protein